MVFLPIVAPLSVALMDVSAVFYAGAYHHGDPAPFAELVWQRRPTEREIAKLIPRHKHGRGYGHVRCKGISGNGRLVGCQTVNSVGADPRNDPDFEKAALKAVRMFRADGSFTAAAAREIEFVRVDLEFQTPGSGPEGRWWGNCLPFCVIEGPPPPPPPP